MQDAEKKRKHPSAREREKKEAKLSLFPMICTHLLFLLNNHLKCKCVRKYTLSLTEVACNEVNKWIAAAAIIWRIFIIFVILIHECVDGRCFIVAEEILNHSERNIEIL